MNVHVSVHAHTVLQLQLHSPFTCASLATLCLLHFRACGMINAYILCIARLLAHYTGDAVHAGISQFLLAQATLFMNHQPKGLLKKEGYLW